MLSTDSEDDQPDDIVNCSGCLPYTERRGAGKAILSSEQNHGF